MEGATQLASSTIEALLRNYFLWIAILTVLYAFSLYIYFFPTPLTEPFAVPQGVKSKAELFTLKPRSQNPVRPMLPSVRI